MKFNIQKFQPRRMELKKKLILNEYNIRGWNKKKN